MTQDMAYTVSFPVPWSEPCELQAANMLLENNLPKELAHLNRGLPLHTDTGAHPNRDMT